jgi:hypothetical protein
MPAALSTSWPPPAGKGSPRSLPSPAPPTSHRRTETLQGRGDVPSYTRRCRHLQIWLEVGRPQHAPHPPPLRCPRNQGDVLQHPADAAHRQNNAAPSKGRRPGSKGPAKDVAGSTPHQSPQPNAGEAELEERRRKSAEQHLAAKPNSHPAARLQAVAREALRADPRRPPHRHRRLGRKAPQGTARGGGTEEEGVAARARVSPPWSPWKRRPEERFFFHFPCPIFSHALIRRELQAKHTSQFLKACPCSNYAIDTICLVVR